MLDSRIENINNLQGELDLVHLKGYVGSFLQVETIKSLET
jgi:hypothetical protein